MTKLDQLQELSDLVDGLTNEKTVEALVDLKDKLEDIAALANDENLQAANEIIDNLSDPKTVENIENVESALDRLIEKIDTLRDLDDAISNVAAYNPVVEELVSNLDNALQLKAQLDEADVDE